MTNETLTGAAGNKKLWAALWLLGGLLYLLFRLWHLTDSCLWFDEIFSVHAAEMPLGDLTVFVSKDLIHPPLFYVFLKFWISIGGDSLAWLRYFPVLASAAALIPFYLLGARLRLGNPAMTMALALFAVNGALIKYAQEVRMYSLLLFFSILSIWLLVRFLEEGKGLAALTAINILLIYTHYFGWLVILAELAAIVILNRNEIKRFLLSIGSCFLSFLPWMYAVWQAAQTNADLSQNLGWAAKPGSAAIFQFIFDLFEPFYFQASSIDYASNYLVSIPMFLLLAAAAGFYFAFWKTAPPEDRKKIVLLLIFVLVPTLAAVIFSWILPFSIWGTRHLIVVFAPGLILLADILGRIKFAAAKIALISTLGLFILFALIFEIRREPQQFIWCGWESLAQNLDGNQPKTVYVFEDLVAYHFWFAVRGQNQTRIVRVKDVPEMIEDKAYFLPRGFDAVPTVGQDGMTGDRFWIAFRDMKFDERHPPLNILKEKGYNIGEPQVYDANGLKAYLVEVRR